MIRSFCLYCWVYAGNGMEIVDAEHGDIIRFYNEIYMQKMTPYALKFNGKQNVVREHIVAICCVVHIYSQCI